jgi:hypothetical protein
MELTIIGIYEDQNHARSAKNELLASGFVRSNVQMNPDHDFTAADRPSTPHEQHSGLTDSIGNFFRSLFSQDDKSTYSNVYADAVKRGETVLTVDVASEEQRIRAEEIMERHGPVDIDERSAQGIRQGWRGHDPDAPADNLMPGSGRLRSVLRRKEPE